MPQDRDDLSEIKMDVTGFDYPPALEPGMAKGLKNYI